MHCCMLILYEIMSLILFVRELIVNETVIVKLCKRGESKYHQTAFTKKNKPTDTLFICYEQNLINPSFIFIKQVSFSILSFKWIILKKQVYNSAKNK